MFRQKFSFLWLLLLLLCLTPGLSAAETPQGVKTFSPSGRVSDNVAFKIVFTNPMVQRAKVGKTVGTQDFPFVISPSVQAEGKWLDSKTFSASLLAPLEAGTAYKASLQDGLKDLKGKGVGPGTFFFQTDSLMLDTLQAVMGWDNTASLRLNFNAPVSPSRLSGFLSVLNEENKPLQYRILGGAPSSSLNVSLSIGAVSKPTKLRVKLASGLTGQTGNLGLEEDVIRTVVLRPTLLVSSLFARESGIVIDTNFSIDPAQAKDFIQLEPPVPFRIDSIYEGRIQLCGEMKPRDRFVVTLKKGLPSKSDGLVLAEAYQQAVIMPDLAPLISFPVPGTFLSPSGGGRLPLELRNVNKIKVELWRLYENNLPFVLRPRESYYYDGYSNGDASFQKDLARRIYSKDYTLSLPLNETIRRSLSLEELAGGLRGLFLLSVSNQDKSYWDETSQIVNLSDMGLVVRLWEDGALAWVNTLSTTQPLEGATVRIYSQTNQVLAEGLTDAEGVCLIQRDKPWDPEEGTPALAVVTLEDDISFVKLNRDLLSREIFDTAGRPWLREGYDAMLFSARDIYRTGETVPFKTIVRNADISTPQPFPVLISIQDPLGRLFRRETLHLSDEGAGLFSLPLPPNAMTGLWRASILVPGKEDSPLAVMPFHVEDFAPPRIEVDLEADAKYLQHKTDLNLALTARYLFGVDGAGLTWKGDWTARAADFIPTKDRWKGYVFGDPTRRFSTVSGELNGGVLDDKGKGSTGLLFDAEWEAASIIGVTLSSSVMEPGGRWISKSITLPYYPTPWLLGIADTNESLSVKRDLTFKVAAIDPEENPADPGELSATLYRVSWNYNLVQLDGYTRWQSSEELTEVEHKTFTLKDGVGQVTFRPERWGTYMIRISDEDEMARASLRFYADDPEYADRGGSQLMDRVEISLDKDEYKIGETAKVTLSAPFEGLLLFNVEGEELLFRKILTVSASDTVIEVPVTEKMMPNAWCSAWLIRPVIEEEVWGTHRAVGIAPLKADRSPYRLALDLEAPDKTEPAKPLPVTLTLKDSEGNPAKGDVTLALVDDAVLNLTQYKTPDLLNHFWGFKQMGSKGYDLYDQLMPLESQATEALHPAGGALQEAMGAMAGMGKRSQRFKILSLFEGTLSADEAGLVRAELDVPEFSGRGRLFAVAASGPRFGAAEKQVQIARSIVTEPDLPRFAAPGDTFSAPISVFNSSEESRLVSIDIVAEGGLELDEHRFVLELEPGGSANAAVSVKASTLGNAVWNVTTSWLEDGETKSFKQSIDLPVRSPWPVTAQSGSGLLKAGETSVELPKEDFLQGLQGTLTLADTPAVDLNRAISFLLRYPYGCLEQVLSAAWPFLVLPEAIAKVDPLLVNDDSVRLKTESALARVQSMQLYDGSFARWPGDTAPYNWGSVYATHFLIEARKADVPFPDDMLKGALNWIRAYLASMPGNNYPTQEKDDFTTKAYAVYVLALNGEKPLGWLQYLEENKANMWPSGSIYLAGAASCIEGRADALRDLGTGASGKVPSESRYETLDSDVRNTALLLSLWSEVEPNAPEALKLATQLVKWGQENRWYSTQENSAAAMALGRYLLKTGSEKANLEGKVKDSDGKTLLSFKSGQSASLPLSDQTPADLTLSLQGSGQGYYTWNLIGASASRPEPQKQGVEVAVLWSDKSGTELDLSKGFAQGDEVQISLTLNPLLPVSNLALAFLLPAGLEIETPQILEENEYPIGRFEARDDRLLLFVDRLSEAKTHRFSLRAVTKGTFVIPPVTAVGMYDPEISFVGETPETLTIR